MDTDNLNNILKYLKSKGTTQKKLAHDHLVRTESSIQLYKKGEKMPEIVENKILSVFRDHVEADIQEEIRLLIARKVNTPADLSTLTHTLRSL